MLNILEICYAEFLNSRDGGYRLNGNRLAKRLNSNFTCCTDFEAVLSDAMKRKHTGAGT